MFKIQIDKSVKTPKQYSKVWMTRWQVFVMVWLSAFFLADIYFNQCAHLETLCITLVTSVIGTVLGYFTKSYFESKQEKNMEYLQSCNGNLVNNIMDDTLQNSETQEVM